MSTCWFELSNIADTDTVQVRSGGSVIPRDTSHVNGWDFVDANTIEMYGSSCLQAIATGAQITIEYCSEYLGG